MAVCGWLITVNPPKRAARKTNFQEPVIKRRTAKFSERSMNNRPKERGRPPPMISQP